MVLGECETTKELICHILLKELCPLRVSKPEYRHNKENVIKPQGKDGNVMCQIKQDQDVRQE